MLKKVTEKKLLGPLRKINGLLEEIRSGRAFASTSPPPGSQGLSTLFGFWGGGGDGRQRRVRRSLWIIPSLAVHARVLLPHSLADIP